MTVNDTKGSDVSSQQGPGGVVEGLAVLSKYLEDDGRRQTFATSSEQALQEAGIPAGVIPAATMAALESCSPDQLAAIVRVGKGLEGDGMYVDVPGGFGRVFFF